MAEYSGAVLGVLSVLLYGRRSHIWKKVLGLIAMMVSFYLLSQGWATTTFSPFSFEDRSDLEESDDRGKALDFKTMAVPVAAGILSALRRVIARRVSLKNQLKRRLHTITIASATCFLFPFAMWDTIIGSSDSSSTLPFSSWVYLSVVLFGIVLIFYVDNIAEERLHLVFSSPKHLMVAGGCIIVMEIVYKMDFSLLGFLVCASILSLGIIQATSLERTKKESLNQPEIVDGTFESPMETSPLPT